MRAAFWKGALLVGGLTLAHPVEAAIARAEPSRWALVVTVGQYPMYPTRGSRGGPESVEAAERLATLLQDRFGFAPERILRLPNEKATTSGLYATVADLREKVRPGDSVFIYLALQVARGAKEGNAFVPYDGRLDEPWTWIPVVAAFEAFATLRSGALLVAVDSCLPPDDSYNLRPNPNERQQQVAPRPQPAIEIMAGCPGGAFETVTLADALVDELRKSADGGRTRTAADLRKTLEQSLASIVLITPMGVRESFAFVPAPTDPTLAALDGARSLETRKQAVALLGERLRSEQGAPSGSPPSRALLGIAANEREAEELRLTAIAALAESGHPGLATDLARILAGARSSPRIRLHVVSALEQLKGPAAIQALETAAAKSDPATRAASIRSLTQLQSRSSIPVVARALGDASVEVQAASLDAIQLFGAAASSPALVASVLSLAERSRGNVELRRGAVTTLGLLGDPQSESALLRYLQQDQDAGVRAAAASSLGRLSTHADKVACEAALARALNDGAGVVREAAAVALGRLPASAAGPLVTALDDLEARVRSAAAEALGKLAGSDGHEALRRRLAEDESTDVRRAAVTSLKGVCDEATQSALANRAVGDRDGVVREAAQRVLTDCRTRAPATSTIETGVPEWAVRSNDPRTRAAALARVAASGSPRAIDELVKALGDSDYSVRETATRLLGGMPASLPALQAVLAAGDPLLRAGAVSAAGRQGTPEALALVRPRILEKDQQVRLAAIRALGNFTDPSAIDAAEQLSRYRDPETCLAAAEALSAQSGLLYASAQYERGLSLAQRAHETRLGLLPPLHADLATDLNNLAVFHQRLGDLTRAQQFLEEALGMRMKLFGEEHPEVAVSLSNLASVFSDRKLYERAEPLLLQALRVRQKVQGPRGPEVVQSLQNLAKLYRAWGRADDAERYDARVEVVRHLSAQKTAN